MKYVHPKRFLRVCTRAFHDWFFYYLIPDEWEIRYRFKKILGYECNLNNPKTFNEKIQWLKLHDRNPLYPQLTDKLLVKDYVAQVIGDEYIIPTLFGGFSHFDEIPFDSLPNQFVLKCNHDSKSTFVCKEKDSFDFGFARTRLENSLKRNYYHYKGKQWGYKNIKPQIFVEKFMSENEGEDLKDYKFFMFNGECKAIFYFVDRFATNGPKMNAYNTNWEFLPLTWGKRDNLDSSVPKPSNLDEMIQVAEKLADAVHNSFVRVDLYSIHGHIYFGEYTFYPGGGFDEFTPKEWDTVFGNWLDLEQHCLSR